MPSVGRCRLAHSKRFSPPSLASQPGLLTQGGPDGLSRCCIGNLLIAHRAAGPVLPGSRLHPRGSERRLLIDQRHYYGPGNGQVIAPPLPPPNGHAGAGAGGAGRLPLKRSSRRARGGGAMSAPGPPLNVDATRKQLLGQLLGEVVRGEAPRTQFLTCCSRWRRPSRRSGARAESHSLQASSIHRLGSMEQKWINFLT